MVGSDAGQDARVRPTTPAPTSQERLERAAELLEDGAILRVLTPEGNATKLVIRQARSEARKLRVIESIDRAVARLAEPPFADAIVCITGDHATPPSPEVIHSGDPVPFAIAGPGVRADGVDSFGELNQRAGILGHIEGSDVMPVLLNAADRPLFAGSRPGVDPYAAGHPLAPHTLKVAESDRAPAPDHPSEIDSSASQEVT